MMCCTPANVASKTFSCYMSGVPYRPGCNKSPSKLAGSGWTQANHVRDRDVDCLDEAEEGLLAFVNSLFDDEDVVKERRKRGRENMRKNGEHCSYSVRDRDSDEPVRPKVFKPKPSVDGFVDLSLSDCYFQQKAQRQGPSPENTSQSPSPVLTTESGRKKNSFQQMFLPLPPSIPFSMTQASGLRHGERDGRRQTQMLANTSWVQTSAIGTAAVIQPSMSALTPVLAPAGSIGLMSTFNPTSIFTQTPDFSFMKPRTTSCLQLPALAPNGGSPTKSDYKIPFAPRLSNKQETSEPMSQDISTDDILDLLAFDGDNLLSADNFDPIINENGPDTWKMNNWDFDKPGHSRSRGKLEGKFNGRPPTLNGRLGNSASNASLENIKRYSCVWKMRNAERFDFKSRPKPYDVSNSRRQQDRLSPNENRHPQRVPTLSHSQKSQHQRRNTSSSHQRFSQGTGLQQQHPGTKQPSDSNPSNPRAPSIHRGRSEGKCRRHGPGSFSSSPSSSRAHESQSPWHAVADTLPDDVLGTPPSTPSSTVTSLWSLAPMEHDTEREASDDGLYHFDGYQMAPAQNDAFDFFMAETTGSEAHSQSEAEDSNLDSLFQQIKAPAEQGQQQCMSDVCGVSEGGDGTFDFMCDQSSTQFTLEETGNTSIVNSTSEGFERSPGQSSAYVNQSSPLSTASSLAATAGTCTDNWASITDDDNDVCSSSQKSNKRKASTESSRMPRQPLPGYQSMTPWTNDIATDQPSPRHDMACFYLDPQVLQGGGSDSQSPRQSPPQLSSSLQVVSSAAVTETVDSLTSWRPSLATHAHGRIVGPSVLNGPHRTAAVHQHNREKRFKKTAEALQKCGLWDIAMKTGNLIKRNADLQKEIEVLRSEATVFLKSVIQNPENQEIMDLMNPAISEAPPMMRTRLSPTDGGDSSDTATTTTATTSSKVSDSGCSSTSGYVSYSERGKQRTRIPKCM